MSKNIIEELRQAVDRYETDNCKTEIVSFGIINGGSVLNQGERFRFKIKVTNQSHLDMKNVKVQAVGTSYADVVSSLYPESCSAYPCCRDAPASASR